MLDFIINGIFWILALYGLFEIIKNIIYMCTYTNLKSEGIYVIVGVKNQEDKIESLMDNSGIIRNRRKIIAAIINAQIFKEIAQEFGSFRQYLFTFTEGKTVYENDKTHSELSDKISKDLRQRGMKFVGTTIIYSYLQAIGVINSHEENCLLFSKTDTSSKNSKKTRLLKGNN